MNNETKEVLEQLQEVEQKEIKSIPKDTEKRKRYKENSVANFLKIMVNITVVIAIFILFVFILASLDEDSEVTILEGFITALSFGFIAIVERVFAEIIQLLEDIKNK